MRGIPAVKLASTDTSRRVRTARKLVLEYNGTADGWSHKNYPPMQSCGTALVAVETPQSNKYQPRTTAAVTRG
eukprot:3891789-Prymnesium_polylepis.3